MPPARCLFALQKAEMGKRFKAAAAPATVILCGRASANRQATERKSLGRRRVKTKKPGDRPCFFSTLFLPTGM